MSVRYMRYHCRQIDIIAQQSCVKSAGIVCVYLEHRVIFNSIINLIYFKYYINRLCMWLLYDLLHYFYLVQKNNMDFLSWDALPYPYTFSHWLAAQLRLWNWALVSFDFAFQPSRSHETRFKLIFFSRPDVSTTTFWLCKPVVYGKKIVAFQPINAIGVCANRFHYL